MDRVRLHKTPIEKKKTSYFRKSSSLEFIPSGSTLLDLVLGGGYALKRVSNIIGDKSVGKTQLAIEAMINFTKLYPDGIIWYQETESAFDVEYADSLGPEEWTGAVKLIEDVETVAGTFKARSSFLKDVEKKGVPGLYIIDSLDGIYDTDNTKLAEGFDKARRAGDINDFIGKTVGEFKRSNAAMIIISQVRYNIGVTFGEKYTRCGGKVLDFNAAVCLWLSEIKKIVRTIDGEKKPVSILVKAKAKKNKVGLPYRECEFPIVFNYGIDDVTACVDWLESHDYLDELLDGIRKKEVVEALHSGNKQLLTRMRELVIEKWESIEEKFLPKYKKY